MAPQVKQQQVKRFSERLSSLYSSWNKHLSHQWLGAKLLVVRTPRRNTEYLDGTDPDLDSIKFFEWLFGEVVHNTYIVFSPTQVYAVCSGGGRSYWDYIYDAEFLHCFADEANTTMGLDFVVKDKGSGRTLTETLTRMANGLPGPALPTALKNVVGFIGEEPAAQLLESMEFKDVTDAFYKVAGIK